MNNIERIDELVANCNLPDEDLKALVRQSYEIVKSKKK